jgi:hypothetical protein
MPLKFICSIAKNHLATYPIRETTGMAETFEIKFMPKGTKKKGACWHTMEVLYPSKV